MTDATLLKLNPPERSTLKCDGDNTEPHLAPLTESQESIYILSRLSNGGAAYNMPFAFRLRGPLHLGAFASALGCLVERHHALRANVVETEKGLRQWTWNNADAPLEFHDLSRIEPEKRKKEFAERLRTEARAPFDLARQTPFRAALFKLGADDHAALFTLHHAFGDMASMRILFRDFEAAYNAAVEGRAPSLPAVEMQADEHAIRESGREPRPETIAFWREKSSEMANDLELPADFPRARVAGFNGAAHRFVISRNLAESIKSLARAGKCSAYMAALALLQTLIYRCTNQKRFAIATPFSQRIETELENTVGCLINLLPVPCAPNPRTSFKDLLAEVRQACLDVFAHDDISMRRILQEARIPGDSPRNAFSRVVFQYFAEGPTNLMLAGLDVEPVPFHNGTSKFDLCLTMRECENGIETEIEYDSDLFAPATVERFAQRFVNLAESVTRNPEVEIGQLNYLTASEKCFLAEINETKSAYPREMTVTGLFEQQAARNPAKIAISFENSAVTYLELNRRAEQVAQFLIKRGVRAGDFVGVCLERSPELVAALIGILKAGAAFVPFDAKYPESRLKYLFEDAGVRLLVTSVGQRRIAPASVEVALIEEAAAEEVTEGSASAKPLLSPDSLAYMMYTSGSTGNPKGVTVPHRAIVRLVKNNDFARMSPDDVFLLFAPISFDASTLEIWAPLLNGGALAIYPPNFESLDQFAAVLDREKVTTLWLTSGFFNTVVDEKIDALRNVRQLLVGGDVVSALHVRRLYDANPAITIINGYGPTENTTFTCCYTIPRDWPADRAIPIGRPIRNTQVYILDENLQPMPVGLPGELYCGGDGLSHGYWNKPDLTAQLFVAHPFFAGARLYKTGDRVRLLSDGNIEFLGRVDSQVKLRGFRIELGEIESAFRQLPGTQDAAAVIEHDGPNGKSLHVFVIARANESVTAERLHEQIAALLPEHARPSRIHVVDHFPLGPNGKVDRKALLVQAAFDESSAETNSAPALNPTEAVIAGIWKAILGAGSAGPEDNFFHMGGDSLRAIQAVLQINRALDRELTLSDIFEAPTVRGLARRIESANREQPIPRAGLPSDSRHRDVSELTDAEVDTLLNELMVNER